MKHEVIQADEDAAIAVRKHESGTGYINHDALAQAFAAHRIATERRFYELCEAAAALNIATDGQESLRPQRQRVLDALKAIEAGAHRND